MLLINPPVTKPCEPPAGLARLAGVLRGHGLPCELVDAGIEGLHHLLSLPVTGQDTWSRRAGRNRQNNLTSLKAPDLYQNRDRYRRAISDLNRVLDRTGRPNFRLSLANYQETRKSPHSSADLIAAFKDPEASIFHPYYLRRFGELLKDNCPESIGISLNYLSQALPAFALAGLIRRLAPDSKIIMGGGLITSWLSSPSWQEPFRGIIDHLVAGPGEDFLLKQAGLPGGAEYFPPDYSGLPLKSYLAPGLILPYAASSGCYWNHCLFCPEKAENNPYQQLPPRRAALDLQRLVSSRQPSLIHLLDNAVSPSLMRELINHPPGAGWYGFARISQELADRQFCKNLRKSGCLMLKLGLESGSQPVLDAMVKGIDLRLAARVLKELHRAGIATYVYLLFGTPHETRARAAETLDFTLAHHRAITFLNLAVFNLPVNSPESAELETRVINDEDLCLYQQFEHPRGWNRPLIRNFLDREFKPHEEINAIINRDPPVFTSNHAPFFL